MNALDNIQNEASVIVDQLADRQIADMKRLDDAFQEWLAVDGNAIALRLVDQVDLYNSTYKYIYMTHFRIYNRETCKYERPTTYNNTYAERREMGYSKDLMHMVNDLRTMTSSNWEVKYRELFVTANMVKLNRALGKHINNEMHASEINVTTGGDGAEVTAVINGMMKFKTFGTLCGGNVQCYHYRYRSSLKSIKR
jgi:transcription elongation factor GreA-like protein